jgi:hypothetical protein
MDTTIVNVELEESQPLAVNELCDLQLALIGGGNVVVIVG